MPSTYESVMWARVESSARKVSWSPSSRTLLNTELPPKSSEMVGSVAGKSCPWANTAALPSPRRVMRESFEAIVAISR
ncbi:hypothetical protein ADK58_26850 [Streptomyces sp. XY152]|nr:hypothetical protein ADK58_26850 [Streptomyces sp. XY152]